LKKLAGVFTACLLFFILTACGAQEDSGQEDNSTAESSETVVIKAMNWQFDKEEYEAGAGDVTVELKNEEGNHGIVIVGADNGSDLVISGSGSKTVTLEPGEYEIQCNIPCGPGHEEMVSTLVVS
jgi:cytochrome c oxidase subunit II